MAVAGFKELKKALSTGVIYPREISELLTSNLKSFKKSDITKYAELLNSFNNKNFFNAEETVKKLEDTKKWYESLENSSQSLEDKYSQVLEESTVDFVNDSVDSQYGGDSAEWLPSEAEDASIDHMENYYEEFSIGEGINGEMPGERNNCQCGYKFAPKQEEEAFEYVAKTPEEKEYAKKSDAVLTNYFWEDNKTLKFPVNKASYRPSVSIRADELAIEEAYKRIKIVSKELASRGVDLGYNNYVKKVASGEKKFDLKRLLRLEFYDPEQ